MRSSTVQLVIGTRPEAIKLAPLAHALTARGTSVELVFTGQHPSLDPAAFGLSQFTLHRLECPAAADPHTHARLVAQSMRTITRPAMVLVQGDTSSALGGALAARALGVPLGHVEAGLRSHDLALPWPEEGNRVAVDRMADLLFAPTVENAANLIAEQVGGEIHVTGNTAIDALFSILGDLPPRLPRRHGEPARLLVTCHRRENWGAAFEPIAEALLELAAMRRVRVGVVLHNNPAMADSARRLLGDHQGIELLAPMDHRSMVAALRSSDLVLSDSGGVQEEAPALGIPLLILRATTERPEGIASGNSLLVGNDPRLIVRTARHLLENRAAYRAMAVPALPFGDGQAADRIAKLCTDWLAERQERATALIG